MAEAGLSIQFVWVDTDWPDASPLKDQNAISRPAFAFRDADSRQPGLSLATRRVAVGCLVDEAFEKHLSPYALERLAAGEISAAVFGRRARPSQPLYEADRIELLGPVTADPKGARRARVRNERQESARDKWKTRVDGGPGP